MMVSSHLLDHHLRPHINFSFVIIAWLAYRGKVYDVSNWESHPGRYFDDALCFAVVDSAQSSVQVDLSFTLTLVMIARIFL